jgi:hypothetical protein
LSIHHGEIDAFVQPERIKEEKQGRVNFLESMAECTMITD